MKEKPKEPITPDDTSIVKFASSIANDVLKPSVLFNDVSNNVCDWETPGRDDFTALCTATQSDYPDLVERYRKGETGDVEVHIAAIKEEAWFYIGLAVGRRLR